MVLIRINEKGLEDAYWVMFLLCKPEDLSSDHQAPHKKKSEHSGTNLYAMFGSEDS